MLIHNTDLSLWVEPEARIRVLGAYTRRQACLNYYLDSQASDRVHF